MSELQYNRNWSIYLGVRGSMQLVVISGDDVDVGLLIT